MLVPFCEVEGTTMGLFENLSFDSFLSKEAFANKPDKDKEMELVERYKKNNDLMALKELKYYLRPLIRKVIQEVNPTNSGIPASTLAITAGNELPNIILKYDPSQAALNTFVYGQLKLRLNNTVNEIQPGAHVSRPDRVLLKQYQSAKREAEAEHGKNPTDEQIFNYAKGTSLENDWDQFQRVKQYEVKNYIGDATHSGGEDGDEMQFKDLFDTTSDIDKKDEISSLKLDRLDQLAKNRLDPQEYQIVKQTLFEGNPRVKVALSLGVPGTQIKKAIDKWMGIVKQEGLNI